MQMGNFLLDAFCMNSGDHQAKAIPITPTKAITGIRIRSRLFFDQLRCFFSKTLSFNGFKSPGRNLSKSLRTKTLTNSKGIVYNRLVLFFKPG
jgi:hypothetical protein